jgi:hypothetical protein
MTTTPDTTETDAELDLLFDLDAHSPTHREYEGGWWELACTGCDALKGQRLSHLDWTPHRVHREKIFRDGIAAIRRQAAADALTRQARHMDGRARFWRDLQHAHENKGRPESADPYRHYADQAHRTADYLRKEADGIIAEGYEYECQECDTPVPDAGDLCEQHDVDDEDKWAE